MWRNDVEEHASRVTRPAQGREELAIQVAAQEPELVEGLEDERVAAGAGG